MGTPLDPIGWVIIGTTLLAGGAQAYGQIQAGNAQAKAYQAEAAAHKLEAEQAALQATQASAQGYNELAANLGTITAMKAGGNVEGDSPTTYNLIRSFTKESLGQVHNAVLEAFLRESSALNAQQSSLQSAAAAKTAGYISGFSTILSTVSQAGGFLRPVPRTLPTNLGTPTRTGVGSVAGNPGLITTPPPSVGPRG